MKIYYYHTRPILEALEEWKEHKHPGHILYGLTHFERNGIGIVIHKYRAFNSRVRMMLYNLFTILSCRQSYDVLYGTSYRGLELIIFLRALGLYRKPIAIWHHQAVPQNKGFIKRAISSLFYRGLDCMFFFSNELIEKSLLSGKVKSNRLHLIHWGPDLEFYDYLLKKVSSNKVYDFISTGKENRDFDTLLSAFSNTNLSLDVFSPYTNGDVAYTNIFSKYKCFDNIHIHITKGIIPYELGVKVAQSQVVVIPCLVNNYTVGLTTLVEAMALSLPIISTDNPTYGIDIKKANIGLLVAYHDVMGWKQAADFLHGHTDIALQMGRNGRLLAEQTFNLENFTRELSVELKKLI